MKEQQYIRQTTKNRGHNRTKLQLKMIKTNRCFLNAKKLNDYFSILKKSNLRRFFTWISVIDIFQPFRRHRRNADAQALALVAVRISDRRLP